MNRRQFIGIAYGTGIIGSTSGCLSGNTSTAEEAELSEVEVWNSDDSKQSFHVTLFNSNVDQIYERTVELSGASKSNFTREELSDAPDSAAEIRAKVGNNSAKKDLRGYDNPLLLSIKYNAEHRLEIVEFE